MLLTEISKLKTDMENLKTTKRLLEVAVYELRKELDTMTIISLIKRKYQRWLNE